MLSPQEIIDARNLLYIGDSAKKVSERLKLLLERKIRHPKTFIYRNNDQIQKDANIRADNIIDFFSVIATFLLIAAGLTLMHLAYLSTPLSWVNVIEIFVFLFSFFIGLGLTMFNLWLAVDDRRWKNGKSSREKLKEYFAGRLSELYWKQQGGMIRIPHHDLEILQAWVADKSGGKVVLECRQGWFQLEDYQFHNKIPWKYIQRFPLTKELGDGRVIENLWCSVAFSLVPSSLKKKEDC